MLDNIIIISITSNIYLYKNFSGLSIKFKNIIGMIPTNTIKRDDKADCSNISSFAN